MLHNSLLVLIHDLFLDGLVEDVNLGRRKFARANMLFKQHVQLSKRAAARLGDAEVGIDDAEEADAAL